MKTISELKSLISRFPGYTLIGNKPYAKGVYLIETGVKPKLVSIFKSNQEAFDVMSEKNFHPSKINQKENTLFGEDEVAAYFNPKTMSNKIISHLLELQELLPLFEVNPSSSNSLDVLLNHMRQIHQQ